MTQPYDLEDRLAELAAALDVPSGERIADAVVAQLRAEPATRPWGRSWPRRRLIAVGALVAALVGGAVAAPAVADWLGVRGVDVRRQEPGPAVTTATVPPAGSSLDLGTPAPSLAAAAEAAGFAAVVPTALGAPDAIWVDRRSTAPFISLVYDGGPLVTAFDATLTADTIVSKVAGPDTVVEHLRINGEPAMWIDGVHAVAVRTRDDDPAFERLRLSDKVLLVQHGALTVRIELPAGFGRADAVRIAESLPR